MALDPQLLELLRSMFSSQTDQMRMQGENNLQLQQGRAAQQREALTPIRRGMSGNIVDPTSGKEAGNPFDNGFFKAADERIRIEDNRLGFNGISGADPLERHAAQAATYLRDPFMMPKAPQQSFDPVGGMDALSTQPSLFAPGFAPAQFNQFADDAISRTDRSMAAIDERRRRRPGSAFAF